MTETPQRYACKECTRTDLSLTANGRVRSHAANGKRPGPDNPNCPGGSDLPRGADAGSRGPDESDPAYEARVTASGGPNPYRAPLPTGSLPMINPGVDPGAEPLLCGNVCSGYSIPQQHIPGCPQYKPPGYDNACEKCQTDTHTCPGCGESVRHGTVACTECSKPDLPHDRTEPDNWRDGIGPAHAHGNPTEEHETWQKQTPSPSQASPQAPAPGSTPATNPTATDAENPSTKGISSERTETAGTRDRTAAVTTRTAEQIVDVFETAKPVTQRAEQQVERDAYGRYKLHHPETGKKQAFQRCTTFSKMLEDTFGLGKWQRRMAAKGLALRPDLLDMVATLDVKQDSQRMDLLLEQAMDAAGQKVAANQGTVCHKHTEDVDRVDTPLDQVPVRYRADVTAYTETLRRAGITIVPQMIERITVVPDLGVGGTLDRVVMDRFGKYRVLDVKTGNMDFGQLGICIQLAVYAHGVNSAGVYDLDTGTWEQSHVPRVETDYALVAHIPVGSGTCELLKVPIDTGWEAVRTAAQVRDWRKMKRLFTAYDPGDVAEDDGPTGVGGYVELIGPSDPRPSEAFPTQTGVHPPTWEDRFRAVTSRAEAMKLYAEAEATLGAGPRLTSLVQLGMATLEQLSG